MLVPSARIEEMGASRAVSPTQNKLTRKDKHKDSFSAIEEECKRSMDLITVFTIVFENPTPLITDIDKYYKFDEDSLHEKIIQDVLGDIKRRDREDTYRH